MSAKPDAVKAKEANELKKWKSAKRTYRGYLLVMMSLLCVVRCLDEFASSVGSSIQSWLVNEFIVIPTGVSYAEGLSTWSLISTAMMVFTILAVFYLALSDRFGRKRILVISVFGMAAGMLICFTARQFPVYLLGTALVTFFIATDVHGIYVMEIAPPEKRAIFGQTTAVFGQVGTFLVALSRIRYTVDDMLNWRMLYLIPGIVGLVSGILLILSARETPVFLKQRIAHLSSSQEEPQGDAQTAKPPKASEKGKQGIGAAFRYIFTHKQTRGNILATVPQLLAIMAFTGYTESIMTTNHMSTSDVNKALLMVPILAAAVSVLTGLLSDHLGRRPTAIVTSILAFLGFIGFILTAQGRVNPYFIGIVYGLCNGSFFRYGDTLGLQRLESVPTNIRAAVASAFGLIATVIALTSGILLGILVSRFDLSRLCLIWGGITLGLSALLNLLLVKETKGIDLDRVETAFES